VEAKALQHVLGLLAQTPVMDPCELDGWWVTPLVGGTNNALYRATRQDGDVVIKWCIRDARGRAEREYAALTWLDQVAPGCAPRPIMLEATRYSKPVVVQTYVDGAVLTAPPRDDAEWLALIACLVRIHQVPMAGGTQIQPAFINADSVAAGRQMIRTQLTAIPEDAWPATLHELVWALDAIVMTDLAPVPLTLCHVDSNHRNFVQTTAGMVAVDWENSGWGDPSFEIAELIAHPAYLTVPADRWQWVIDTYARLMGHPHVRERIATHLRIYRVWWAVRLARYLYEVPRNRDERLVARDADWFDDMQRKYARYVADAWAGLAG
jgi:aminoglycoside phosphotransferase (APT) family kinase protein